VTLRLDVPGRPPLSLDHLLLDVNGTLTDRGRPIEGVAAQLDRLRGSLLPHLLSADTFGTLDAIAAELALDATIVQDGRAKRRLAEELGADRCGAIGNGTNDVPMLRVCALGIVVLGPEGAAGAALAAADVVCGSIVDALGLLLDPLALAATLRP
jgi:soluble P-type ATPase